MSEIAMIHYRKEDPLIELTSGIHDKMREYKQMFDMGTLEEGHVLADTIKYLFTYIKLLSPASTESEKPLSQLKVEHFKQLMVGSVIWTPEGKELYPEDKARLFNFLLLSWYLKRTDVPGISEQEKLLCNVALDEGCIFTASLIKGLTPEEIKLAFKIPDYQKSS